MILTVEKISESFLKVMGDFSVEQDLKAYFTYKAANYRYHPKFKAGLWNGDVSLYNIKTKLLPVGLYNRLVTFCKESDIELVERETSRLPVRDINDVTIEDIQEYVDLLDVTLPNNSKVRDYQLDAIHRAIRNKKITLISPTSSGKSVILYCIIRYILDENPHAKIILMVPTVQLVNQMYSDFQEYSVNNEFNVAKYTQKLFSGQAKELTKNILITTWQSLKNVVKDPVAGGKIMADYTAVIGDEAHTNKSTEIQALLEKCKSASYRIGTTGTLDNEKVHQLLIEGMLGPVYQVITTKELIDTNQVSGLDIKMISLKYPEEFGQSLKKSKATYADEVDFLIGLNKRNEFIAKISCAAKGTTLVLVNHREAHAKPLFELIKTKTDKPVYYVAGDVTPEKREAIRKIANMEDCIIVATFATLSTGVNIPNLRNVVFGSPSKSPVRVLQSIGRGLRLAEGKDKMTLIDIIDDIRFKSRENFAYQHALERITIYRKEKFNIDIKEVPFSVSILG